MPGKSKKRKLASMADTEARYEVEGILDKRTFGKVGELLVKWVDFELPTWEPYKDIERQLPKVVAEFESS